MERPLAKVTQLVRDCGPAWLSSPHPSGLPSPGGEKAWPSRVGAFGPCLRHQWQQLHEKWGGAWCPPRALESPVSYSGLRTHPYLLWGRGFLQPLWVHCQVASKDSKDCPVHPNPKPRTPPLESHGFPPAGDGGSWFIPRWPAFLHRAVSRPSTEISPAPAASCLVKDAEGGVSCLTVPGCVVQDTELGLGHVAVPSVGRGWLVDPGVGRVSRDDAKSGVSTLCLGRERGTGAGDGGFPQHMLRSLEVEEGMSSGFCAP